MYGQLQQLVCYERVLSAFCFLCNCNCATATRLLVVQSYGGSFVSNYNKNHEIEIDTGMRIRNEMAKYEVYNLIVTSTVLKCLLSILIVISTVFKQGQVGQRCVLYLFIQGLIFIANLFIANLFIANSFMADSFIANSFIVKSFIGNVLLV